MVIIDTSVWVTALQVVDSSERREVAALVQGGDAAMVGMVMVELLRGARNQSDFEKLADQLQGPSFLETLESTWRTAGRLLLDLRLRGEVIPVADAVIAAQALEGDHSIYTTDRHFERIANLKLHSPSV